MSKKKKVVIGYFLQSNREFVRDEMNRMRTMYDKYIKGKAIEKKLNTFDGMSNGAFFIDFTEFKPKTKTLLVHKTMQDLIKKAAKAGIISKGMASSFNLGKITAPMSGDKIDEKLLVYEAIKVKPFKKSRKKKKTIVTITNEVYEFLSDNGYTTSDLKVEKQITTVRIRQNGRAKTKKISHQTRVFNIVGGFKVTVQRSADSYIISVEGSKRKSEIFIKPQMVFDNTDKIVLVQMLGRLGIKPKKPRKEKVIKKQLFNSKDSKTKVTTIIFGGKKFSITGTIPGMKRDDFIKKVEKLGGTFQNHITKDTDLLIIGKNPGKGKMEKAKKYKIKKFRIKDAFTF